jgi:hypothetical protein
MNYPQIIEYNDAVQDPRSAFFDPELKNGRVAETPLGLPLALSGGFALTYTVQSGRGKYAVRCFHRAVPEVQTRYAAISTKLRSLGSPYFVSFEFQAQGIRVRGASYPIVKMDWVEGETLGVYLDRSSTDAAALSTLRRKFSELSAFLEEKSIAHGDIQNENVLIEKNRIRLIDYDGMYVPGMKERDGAEVGHKHFQHPSRQPAHFGPRMDRFSFIVLDVSLEVLLIDPFLHKRFREGGQAIVFKGNDFADPSSSEIFRILNGTPTLRESAKKLAAICGAPIANVPSLADFAAGRNIPIVGVTPPPAGRTVYIGAYDVIDGRDFDAVLRRVGDKIELVGEIFSVKQGTGKRGRGRNRPYVFINFGLWYKNSVRVTIWSEGLGNMATQPSAAWKGKWISVTGLVEPPYDGQHFDRSYRNVGITVVSDNQIVHLTEKEAKFRLGRGKAPHPSEPTGTRRTNWDILNEITGDRSAGTKPPPTNVRPLPPQLPAPAKPAGTRNAEILKGLRGTQGVPGSGSLPSPATLSSPSPSTPRGLARVPGWVWLVGGILLLFLLSR